MGSNGSKNWTSLIVGGAIGAVMSVIGAIMYSDAKELKTKKMIGLFLLLMGIGLIVLSVISALFKNKHVSEVGQAGSRSASGKCPVCGLPVAAGMAACPRCGSPMSALPQYSAPQQYNAAQQPYSAPQQQYKAGPQPYAPQQPYAAPQQPYAAPQQPYAAPQQQYAAPQQASEATMPVNPAPQPVKAAPQPAPQPVNAAPAPQPVNAAPQPAAAPAAPASEPGKCPNCGNKVLPQAKFCPFCGGRI